MQKRRATGLTRKELLASERGTVIRKWGGKAPVLIVYPNSYYIGMSNLATHILYKTLNAMPEVVCERYFFEEEGEGISLESGRSLSSFECIFFSLSFELDYINIPKILARAGIAPNGDERKGKDPIVVAGGICVTANPEPIYRFFDLFLAGDVEATIPGFMEKYFILRNKEREGLIDGLSAFPWAYNPQLLSVRYGESGSVDGFSPPDFEVGTERYRGNRLGTSAIITGRTEFADMFLVEGTRGCPSRCPFCLLGNAYKFIQDRITPLDTNVKDIGIIGGGVSFHPHIIQVLRELKEVGKDIHLPSLRIDEVPLQVIELLKGEIKTLTFGIEAGTQSLRSFIGKALTDEAIYEQVEAIMRIKSFNLKLYFMIGLFGETMEHIHAIADLVKHVGHLMVKGGAKRGTVGTITVHASPFVPKAGTPFQWLPMEEMESLRTKIGWLKKAFGKMDNTYFTHESLKHSFIQAVFARGDRRTGDTIMRFAAGDSFAKVMKESPVNLNFYALRQRHRDEIFPWDFIQGRTRKAALYRRLLASLPGPP
jgi:radical SAM superfamily enzyme YgiQ (UPF0313 family)